MFSVVLSLVAFVFAIGEATPTLSVVLGKEFLAQGKSMVGDSLEDHRLLWSHFGCSAGVVKLCMSKKELEEGTR